MEAVLVSNGYNVFNPARKDIETYGVGIMDNPNGDLAEAAKLGLTARDVMRVDVNWILDNADVVALLPGWEKSKGALVEKALAEYLGLEIVYVNEDGLIEQCRT